MHMRIFPASVLCMLAVLCMRPVAAAETDVVVTRDGDAFEVTAHSRVAAPPTLAWDVLADYERYTDFVPNLSVSRIVGRRPLQVEQRGRFGILFFSREIHAVLEVEEQPRSRIAFRALSGDLRQIDTEVVVESSDNGVVIRYRSTITPDFWVPPLIAAPLVRSSMRKKLHAVALEIERRAAGTTQK